MDRTVTPEVWQSVVVTIGIIVVGLFSFLASRRARLARDVAEAVMASISTTNSGSHLKDDIEEIKRAQAAAAQSLDVVKVALVRIEGRVDGQSREIVKLDRDVETLDKADKERAAAAAVAHARLHQRIDELLGHRPRWLRR